MASLDVYRFELFDRQIRAWKRDPRYALLATIESMDGIALRDSGRAVPADQVDAAGFYKGPALEVEEPAPIPPLSTP